MGFIKLKQSKIWIVLSFFWFVGPYTTCLAATEQIGKACETCHQENFNRNLSKRFVHMPYEQRQCKVCHLAGQNAGDNGVKNQRQRSPQKVHWLVESVTPAEDHWFMLPELGATRKLMLEIGIPDGPSVRKEVELPPSDKIPVVVDDNQAPRISDVGVLGISKGLYIEARIGWKTDELASSIVQYGSGDALDQRSLTGNRLTKNHVVLLTGLKKNQTYRYQVVSEDRFGNRQVSEILSFSTRKAQFMNPDFGSTVSTLNKEVRLKQEITRNKDRYLAHISATRPVLLSVGAVEEDPLELAAQAKQKRLGADHPPLQDMRETTTVACYICHETAKGTSSHPVDVRPKPGMVVPKEYKTLPDGRLTCMSCHTGHASDIPFRLIKESKKALCSGCHREMG